MQIEVENLLDGPNTIRLFRNERLVDAHAYGFHPQANFDDSLDVNSQPDTAPQTPISTINDFVKQGCLEISAVKLTMHEPGCIEVMGPEMQESFPVIHFCSWDINTVTDRKEIQFFDKISDKEFIAKHIFYLDIEAQIGIRFLKKGKISLFFAPSQRVSMKRALKFHMPAFESFRKPDWLQINPETPAIPPVVQIPIA